jgi:hypothetical protein
MILRFTSPDVLNTILIDARTGLLAYNIVTRLLEGEDHSEAPLRKTWIYDSEGRVVGNIAWSGRQPKDIVIADEIVGGLTQLFGSSTVRFL